MNAAMVVDVGWVNGLAAIRSLGRAGIRVLALDHRPSALGFRSRYAENVLAPNPFSEEDAFIARVAEVGATLVGPVPIFPTHDAAVNALARHAGELGAFRFPFPGWETLAQIQSKRLQLERAESAGVDIPRTLHPHSATEARAAADEIGYPVLVKPSDSVGFKQRHRVQALRCETPAELDAAFARAESFEPMVQDLIPGGDDTLYTVGSYIATDGRVLGVFCGRKLRQTPPGIGTCRVGEALWVQDAVGAAMRLLQAFAFTGISQVEFKRDPRDGRFRLMEINPRLWQWHGLAAACGVDVTLLAYHDLVGDAPEPVAMDGDGRRWAISLLAGERPILPQRRYVDAVFARDDLKPGFVQIARVAKSTLF